MTTPLPSAGASPAKSVGMAKDDPPTGLTSDEARLRLQKFGPNAMPEAAIVLELALGKYVEAAIIAGLLVFNAALGLFQENRAQATLAALKSRLAPRPQPSQGRGGIAAQRDSLPPGRHATHTGARRYMRLANMGLAPAGSRIRQTVS